MTEKTIKAVVLSEFQDAGTGESFAKGDTPMISEGAFRNYEAAGLVAEDGTTEAKTAKAEAKAADIPTA